MASDLADSDRRHVAQRSAMQRGDKPDFNIRIASGPSEGSRSGSALSNYLPLEMRGVTQSLDERQLSRVSTAVREMTTDLFVASDVWMFRRPFHSDVIWYVTAVSGAPDITFRR
jgi:hypothetical protein